MFNACVHFCRYSDIEERNAMQYEDTASAAEAAAESAKKAIAAAGAAAYLANMKSSGFENFQNSLSKNLHTQTTYKRHSYNVAPSAYSEDESEYDEETEVEDHSNDANRHSNKSPNDKNPKRTHRRHSYNVHPKDTGIKFDESDCEDDIEWEEATGGKNLPPIRPAPEVPSARVDSTHRVHPKLPDYDVLAARFDALKYPRV